MRIGVYLLAAACLRESAKSNAPITRTRAQKLINLLQRAGLETSYRYRMHFYGPFSDELSGDLELLESYGILHSEARERQGDGKPYYILSIDEDADLPELDADFQGKVAGISAYSTEVLEIAATYLALLDIDPSPELAMQRLRSKKPDKCTDENLADMRKLLAEPVFAG
ncbi:MAG: hypothetical protein R3F46_14110 [bacterium]